MQLWKPNQELVEKLVSELHQDNDRVFRIAVVVIASQQTDPGERRAENEHRASVGGSAGRSTDDVFFRARI